MGKTLFFKNLIAVFLRRERETCVVLFCALLHLTVYRFELNISGILARKTLWVMRQKPTKFGLKLVNLARFLEVFTRRMITFWTSDPNKASHAIRGNTERKETTKLRLI